jgi:hypothetical protein
VTAVGVAMTAREAGRRKRRLRKNMFATKKNCGTNVEPAQDVFFI